MATRSEWKDRVDRWQKSGLSAAAFAAREGLEPKQLVWWRWKLRTAPPARSPAPEVRFLPVRVVDSAPRPPTSAPALEIVLANGRIVRVPPGFDPAMLGAVLSIASGGASC